MEEKHYKILLQSFEASWAAGDDAYPDRIVNSFREGLRKFEKYYCPIPEEVILDIIRTKFPNYGKEDDLGPRVKTTTQQITPDIHCNNKVSETVNETWTPTPAPESWADQLIAEAFPEPKKQRKVKHDPRLVKKNIAKELIIDFLHNDQNKRRGFKISDIYEQVEWVHHFEERSMRTYLNELYKAGRVKMWRKPVIQPKGQKVYHFLYTAATNPNPNFTLWVEK